MSTRPLEVGQNELVRFDPKTTSANKASNINAFNRKLIIIEMSKA